MDRTRALIRYWRNSLADADLRSPVVSEDGAFLLHPLEIVGGNLPQALTQKIFWCAERERGARAGAQTVQEERPAAPSYVPILIAPMTIARDFQHGTVQKGDAKKRYFPLWIPALVLPDGSLQGSPQALPWMSRECLEPMAGDGPVVGSLADFDRFLTETAPPEAADWTSVRRYASQMLQAVAHCVPSALVLDGFRVLDQQGVVLLWKDEKGVGRPLIELYDEVLGRDSTPRLLGSFAAAEEPAAAPSAHDLGRETLATRHCGQMGRSFPLSPSQRQAIHCALPLAAGRILAVNGPPGTGKTTLLQSVVASLWVEAALGDREPPVIFACSTNNQAVTNILESFAAAACEGSDPLAERWLPDLGAYGLHLPSADKFKEAKYQQAFPGNPWRGLPESMENRAYVERAEAFFVTRARTVLPRERCGSVKEIVRHLQERLVAVQGELAACIGEAREVQAWRTRYGCLGTEEARRRIDQDRESLEARMAEEAALYDEVLAAEGAIPLWTNLLAFLPPVRRHRDRHLSMPFLRRRREPPPVHGPDGARSLLDALRKTLDALKSQIPELRPWQELEARFAARVEELQDNRSDFQALGKEALERPELILDLLDCGPRHRLFLLAGRYWEGRWLLEMERLLASDQRLDRRSRSACEERFRRFAKLTPCLVATIHRSPKVFDSFDPGRERNVPMFDFLDLLIVDEAGQVTPEVGAAAFSLAKRGLVVGDLHQIEPVWGIGPSIDTANLRKAGLETDLDGGEDAIAHRASRGSLMLMARRATAVTREDDRGLFLGEHRRCVPEIIRYCNELVYKNRLRPLRPSKQERILPPLGWAHITSPEEISSGSRRNPGEARAIADWLARHRDDLERHYEAPIERIVAVITPFAAQRWVLAGAFKAQGLPAIKAGTVHTFQGAESPVVLFSPVYSLASTQKIPHRLFFDAGPNLLNVAASRAKDSFLVFGDLRLFDRNKPHLPSGLLGRFLFESPDHEITDVEAAQHLVGMEDTNRISTLAGHREMLSRALTRSTDRVLVVSPFLTERALEADGIPEAVGAARSRGVQVCVVYSVDLNQGVRKASALKAAEGLRQAGAEVVASNRMHSKTLAVDDHWIVEGSFNWLSAVRDEGDRYQRYEASICCEGPGARRLIQSAWREVLGRDSP